MCTVSFIPAGNAVYLTSSRDESALRSAAALPETYTFSTGKILFPKDRQAGGTWIALHENGNAMVLLNGAAERHEPAPPYRSSRGLIFLDIFDSPSPQERFRKINLAGIEPFTLVIWEQQQHLLQARWDGSGKEITLLPPVPHIWSSTTLYSGPVREKREQWFRSWLKTSDEFNITTICGFHEHGGDGDAANDLQMNRDGKLYTVSISGIALSGGDTLMHYHDLCSGLRSFHTWKVNHQHILL